MTYDCKTSYSSYSSYRQVTCSISTLETQQQQQQQEEEENASVAKDVNSDLSLREHTPTPASTLEDIHLNRLISNNEDIWKSFNMDTTTSTTTTTTTTNNGTIENAQKGLLFELQSFWDAKFEDDKNFDFLDL